MSTPDRLDVAALRDLHEKATEGPWGAANEHGDLGPGVMPAWCVSRMDGKKWLYDVAYLVPGEQEQADAEFIAAARNALPALLDAYEAVERVRALHRQVRLSPSVSECVICLHEWPCDTATAAAALEGTPEPEPTRVPLDSFDWPGNDDYGTPE